MHWGIRTPFVFGFIILNQASTIGLVIAAKSVFRFGPQSRAKDRKLTEYIKWDFN